ncbi:hypothetical protein KKE26_03415 [bacterium]|nr:hypothetical protein [bacterium]
MDRFGSKLKRRQIGLAWIGEDISLHYSRAPQQEISGTEGRDKPCSYSAATM